MREHDGHQEKRKKSEVVSLKSVPTVVRARVMYLLGQVECNFAMTMIVFFFLIT